MPSLSYSVEDGLARIALDRPERLNAFDEELAHAWTEAAVAATSSAEVGAILIEGRGPSFCAGGDLHAMSGLASGAELTALAHVINRGILALLESATPVVVAAQGTTAGGGLGILLAGDLAVIAEDSRIGSRYASAGLTPDLSVTALLADAVGERRALELLLTPRMLGAQEALAWGLVTEVVLAGEVGARAEAIARGWLEGSARAYGEAKRLIRSRRARDLREQLAEEARSIGAAFDTAETRARIAAFVAKA